METLKKALASFCPALDSTEQLRRFYDTIAPDFDDGGFRLYDAALAISGYPNLPASSPMRTTAAFLTMLTDTSSCGT